jgi:hypothetical protein
MNYIDFKIEGDIAYAAQDISRQTEWLVNFAIGRPYKLD